MIDQIAAKEMLYQSVKDRLTISCSEYINAIKNWEIVPLKRQNEVIGAVLIKGNEVHIGYGKPAGAALKAHLRLTLKKLLDKYGYVVTYVQNDNLKGLNFCKRLGFIELSQDSVKIFLRCDGSKYV
jgi:hypothetical protein